MRFVQLTVDSFQGIERASVDFGPGLNVLYGPNDLGKSTLVTALRAALLLPAKSSEGDAWVPWYRDAVPQVSLTFCDDTGRFWRVKKAFGEHGGASELSFSKDGTSFTLDAKNREVDEKVRGLLELGARGPGGKGGAKGLPSSFLINALLAGQTEVGDVLGADLDGDLEENGRLRLTRALAALAQDPVFKQVLEVAQAEVDAFFTGTGRRKSGARSAMGLASAQVKRLLAELEALRVDLAQLGHAEAQAHQLRERSVLAASREQEALSTLRDLEQQHQASRVRAALEVRVGEARRSLSAIDELLLRAKTLAAELVTLEQQVTQAEETLHQREEDVAQANAAVRAAEEALQRAQSAKGAQARELKRATLTTQASQLEAANARLEAQREKALAAIAQLEALEQARAEHARSQKALEAGRSTLTGAVHALAEVDQQLGLARAIIDYGQWQQSVRMSERAGLAAKDAAAQRARAAAALARRETLAAQATALEDSLAAQRAELPSPTQVDELMRLERDLEQAAAALGGGLSITLKPNDALRLLVKVDDEDPVEEPKVSAERSYDANRSLSVSIGKMIDIEVIAGTKEGRKHHDALKKRWRTEGLSALTRAGVSSTKDLQARLKALDARALEAKGLHTDLARLGAEAASALEQAALLDRQADSSETSTTLEQRKARIGAHQLSVLESMFASLGETWEPQARQVVAAAEAARAKQSEVVSKAQTSVEVHLERSARAQQQLQALEAEVSALGGADEVRALASRTVRELQDGEQRLLALKQQLMALTAEQSAEVTKTTAALDAAKRSLEQREDGRATAQRALEAARDSLNVKRGELGALQAQVRSVDRAAALEVLEGLQTQLAPLLKVPLVSEDAVARAKEAAGRAQQDAKDATAEFNKADGALAGVGGPQLREQELQLEEALVVAKAREAELELDAAAWQLLLTSLREAENQEGAHLGRALAIPVAERFSELTQGRYGSITMTAGLSTAGVAAEGTTIAGEAVLGALSVGTKDQLATLIRLAIARQLGSALILDDHLVHTDPDRQLYFLKALKQTALDAQVLIFTCRPQDYLSLTELSGAPTHDLAGGSLRVIDLGHRIAGWPERTSLKK